MTPPSTLSIVSQNFESEKLHVPKNLSLLKSSGITANDEDSPTSSDIFKRLLNQFELLDRLMDQFPDPIFVYDSQGRHTYVNVAGEKLLGLTQADWSEKTWEEMGLPGSVAKSLRSWSQPVFKNQSSLMMEQTLPTVDGMRTFECLLKPIHRIGPNPLAMNCLRDITDRKRAEEEAKCALLRESQTRKQAERACRRSNKLLLVTAALSEALSASDVVEVILGQAITTLDGHAGGIVLLNEAGTHLEHLGSVGLSSVLIQLHQHLTIQSTFPLAKAIRMQEPIWVESEFALSTEFPAFAALITSTETRALAAIPLVVEGKPIGAMSLRFKENRTFTQEERDFILTLAGQCAHALERARCYEREKKRE